MYKAWVSVHFRKRDVQIEMNMQDGQHTYRLVYNRQRQAEKGLFVRRKLRNGSSIGASKWGDGPCVDAMVAFEQANKRLIRDMGEAWMNNTPETDDVWSIFRESLERNLNQWAGQ